MASAAGAKAAAFASRIAPMVPRVITWGSGRTASRMKTWASGLIVEGMKRGGFVIGSAAVVKGSGQGRAQQNGLFIATSKAFASLRGDSMHAKKRPLFRATAKDQRRTAGVQIRRMGLI
jgi:hypothetical protein